MKSSVRHGVCPAEQRPKSGGKRDGRNNSEGVWKRLGLLRPTPKHRLSFMSPLSYVARYVGGKAEFMNLARLSTDERIRRLVSAWDGASRSDRRYLSIEGLAEACDIDPADLFGAVAAACYENGLDFSPLLRACYGYLEAVEATVRGALREGGSRERERMMKRMRLVGGGGT